MTRIHGGLASVIVGDSEDVNHYRGSTDSELGRGRGT